MATNPQPVDELEQQAERERERIHRRVAEIRNGLEQRLDVRRIAEDRIHERPGAIYGATAAFAALTGYIFARLLKT
ncbi:MAG: hypothetical protein ACRD25_10190 [Terracidiphilus sp.]